jgi:hypothetical protein
VRTLDDTSFDQLRSGTRSLLESRAKARERDEELIRQAWKRVLQSRLVLRRSAKSLHAALVARAALASLLPPSLPTA